MPGAYCGPTELEFLGRRREGVIWRPGRADLFQRFCCLLVAKLATAQLAIPGISPELACLPVGTPEQLFLGICGPCNAPPSPLPHCTAWVTLYDLRA